MRPRTYHLPIESLSGFTAGVPVVQLKTATLIGCAITGIELYQSTSTTIQFITLTWSRRSTASTFPAGTTPRLVYPNDPASGLTSSTTGNAVGVSTATGTVVADTNRTWQFLTLNGLHVNYRDADGNPGPNCITLLPGGTFGTFQFSVLSAVACTWNGWIEFMEIP